MRVRWNCTKRLHHCSAMQTLSKKHLRSSANGIKLENFFRATLEPQSCYAGEVKRNETSALLFRNANAVEKNVLFVTKKCWRILKYLQFQDQGKVGGGFKDFVQINNSFVSSLSKYTCLLSDFFCCNTSPWASSPLFLHNFSSKFCTWTFLRTFLDNRKLSTETKIRFK